MKTSVWPSRRLAILVFLAGVLSSEARGDGPIHDPFFAIFLSSTGEGIRTEWLQLLHGLWLEHRASVNWCFGNSEARAYKVLQKSLPTPFPSGKPEDDDVCNATSRIGPFICEKQDAIEYYQHILRSDNVEKLPDTRACTAAEGACGPGFFDRGNPAAMATNSSAQIAHPCCEGYFCPPMLTCMMPCPLGAFCPRAHAEDPPRAWMEPDPADKPHRRRWCAPYAYKEHEGVGCGGADRWDVVPQGAFPGWIGWGAGGGDIWCPDGHYCPSPTTIEVCPRGFYCKKGSAEPRRCPPLQRCPKGTDVPDTSWTQPAAALVMTAALMAWLGLVWQALLWYISRTRAKNAELLEEYQLAPYNELEEIEGSDGQSTHSGGEGQSVEDMEQGNGGGREKDALLTPLRGRRAASISDGEEDEGAWKSPAGAMLTPWERAPSSSGLCTPLEVETRPSQPLEGKGSPQSAFTASLQLLSQPVQAIRKKSKRTEMHIEFENLGMVLRTTGKRVLTGVTGQVRHAKLTAIMGPSGAGKTTLLNTLAGKVGNGKVTGRVCVNGRPDRLERYRKISGFVPQDDVVHANLTVEENLLFSARYRLPANMTHAEHLLSVERTIQVLLLAGVRNEVVGDRKTRGISGGQRKRVNIGIELVTDPALLFLDEPTSGLDSTSSKLVTAALQQVSRMGVTMAAVVHQPSYEIFTMFDDLLLLCEGGRTAYYGPLQDAYFERQGFSVPLHANPADVYMDIVAGVLTQSKANAGPRHVHGAMSPPHGMLMHTAAEDLASLWERHLDKISEEVAAAHSSALLSDDEDSVLAAPEDLPRELQRALSDPKHRPLSYYAYVLNRAVHSYLTVLRRAPVRLVRLMRTCLLRRPWREPSRRQDSFPPYIPPIVKAARRKTPGFWRQFVWCFLRTVVQSTRQPLNTFLRYAIIASTGALLGALSDRGRGTIMSYDMYSSYNNIALGLMSTVASLSAFGSTREMFSREAASGLKKSAFFLAVDLHGHFATCMRAAAYLIPYYILATPNSHLWQMYLVCMGITYACTGTGYLLSLCMESVAAQLSAAVFALIGGMLARDHDGRGILAVVYNINYARWGLEGLQTAEASQLVGVWLTARCASMEGMDMSVAHYPRCLTMLALIGILFRCLACASLYLINRQRQK